MLKAYAVALVLATSAPAADNNVEGAKAQEQTNNAQTQVWRPVTGGIKF